MFSNVLVIKQVVSEDGKKVRRLNPVTEPALEELQVCINYFDTFCINVKKALC